MRRSAFPRHRRLAGFSLVELSVVLLIISLLSALALPGYRKIQLSARSAAVENDIRVFAGAFQNYAHDRGDWPADGAAPGEIPEGMANYLARTTWQQPTPIGGAYSWAPNTLQQGERYRAALMIEAVEGKPVSADLNQLVEIDRRLDDGNLDTGNFRLGFRNQPVFVIEH